MCSRLAVLLLLGSALSGCVQAYGEPPRLTEADEVEVKIVTASLGNMEGALTNPFQHNSTLQGTLVGRRLFSFEFPNVAGMCSQASQWVSSAASTIGNAVGLPDVVKIFNEAKTWVQKGLDVAKQGWSSMLALKDHMVKIFMDFEPLKKIFADANGLVELITNQPNMARLVNVVQELLGTSSVLSSLTSALHSVSDMFAKIEGFFQNALSKVTGRRLREAGATAADRELASEVNTYTQLLNGLSFSKIVTVFKGFLPKLDEITSTLTMVQGTLGPVLQALGGSLAGNTHARRLTVQSILNDQQKYSKAISAIVPTWQSVEQQGIELCPHVGDAQGGIGSLKCRVADFAEKAALPSWAFSMVSKVVTGCPQPQGTAQELSECPKTSASAGITDLLGKNANSLGLIIAIIAGLGLLGGGGVAGLAMKKNGGESSSDDSESGSGDDLLNSREE